MATRKSTTTPAPVSQIEMWNDPDPEKYPGLRAFKEWERPDEYDNMDEVIAQEARWKEEDRLEEEGS